MGDVGRRLVFRPGFRVAVEEFDLPEPGPGQLLLRVTRSQISAGTELNGLRELEAAGHGERTSGYTTVGRVERVGPGVAEYAPGDRLLAYGVHASHCLVDLTARPAWHAFPVTIPDGVTDEQACFGVLGDVALHGVRRAGVQIDQSVAIFGAGVIGQLTLQLARAAGAHPRIVVDLVPSRLGLAERLGATHVVDARDPMAVARVREAAGGAGAEAVFHCSANPQILQTLMEAAAERGTVVLTGSAPGVAEIGLQTELLRRELTILGVYERGLDEPHPYWRWTRQRNRRACLRLIDAGQLQVDPLISHVARPAEAESLYRTIAAGAGDWMSILFDWT